MFSMFKRNSQEVRVKQDLLALLAEMEKNLELFYVMDQRQFITNGFLTDVWARVKDLDIIKRHQAITLYAKSMEDFNQALKVFKEYEAWYTSDINNKSTSNAHKLHGLKNELDLKFEEMEALIIPAGQALERQMLELGLLKYE